MNEHRLTREMLPLGVRRDLVRPELPWPETTQAAEGMPRRPWTRVDIEAMVAAGIVDEDERFELIGGEVVPMSPKGARHELVKIKLNAFLQRLDLRDLHIATDSTLWLDDQTFVEPDFCIFPRSIMPTKQGGHDVLLAIEIADTSLHYDLGRKVGIYAAYGVSEVWVINALTLVTRVHRALGAQGYLEIVEVVPGDAMIGVREPSVRLCLSDLGLSPDRD